jgi:hypothetical protein
MEDSKGGERAGHIHHAGSLRQATGNYGGLRGSASGAKGMSKEQYRQVRKYEILPEQAGGKGYTHSKGGEPADSKHLQRV